ncbi:MAG: FoF1 ATP synthase subunit a [bacterium]
MNVGIFDYTKIQPFKIFGLEDKFWIVHIDVLLYTWAAMCLLFILAFVGQRAIKQKKMGFTLIAFEYAIGFFINLCKDSFATFNYNHFAFITSIFYFTLFCCLIGLIPGLDESTKDLNTTLALGLTSFLYVQYQIIKIHGFKGFLKELAQPFIFMAPIHVVGELSKIASMSFRLFGNILGGSIIFTMGVGFVENFASFFIGYVIIMLTLSWIVEYFDLFPTRIIIRNIIKWGGMCVYILAFAQMFFGIFEGMIQSFVLTMLTTVYLAMGLGPQDEAHETEDLA